MKTGWLLPPRPLPGDFCCVDSVSCRFKQGIRAKHQRTADPDDEEKHRQAEGLSLQEPRRPRALPDGQLLTSSIVFL
jgi:hypothetical protein